MQKVVEPRHSCFGPEHQTPMKKPKKNERLGMGVEQICEGAQGPSRESHPQTGRTGQMLVRWYMNGLVLQNAVPLVGRNGTHPTSI